MLYVPWVVLLRAKSLNSTIFLRTQTFESYDYSRRNNRLFVLIFLLLDSRISCFSGISERSRFITILLLLLLISCFFLLVLRKEGRPKKKRKGRRTKINWYVPFAFFSCDIIIEIKRSRKAIDLANRLILFVLESSKGICHIFQVILSYRIHRSA